MSKKGGHSPTSLFLLVSARTVPLGQCYKFFGSFSSYRETTAEETHNLFLKLKPPPSSLQVRTFPSWSIRDHLNLTSFFPIKSKN